MLKSEFLRSNVFGEISTFSRSESLSTRNLFRLFARITRIINAKLYRNKRVYKRIDIIKGGGWCYSYVVALTSVSNLPKTDFQRCDGGFARHVLRKVSTFLGNSIRTATTKIREASSASRPKMASNRKNVLP